MILIDEILKNLIFEISISNYIKTPPLYHTFLAENHPLKCPELAFTNSNNNKRLLQPSSAH